jgi:imidazolonepropionase-like amidohydrolase
MLSKVTFAGATALLFAAMPASAQDTAPQLYHGFTLLDPESATAKPNAWLVVRNGRIDLVGSGTLPQGEYERHDMRGLYGMPGLIDAHAHLTAGPQRITMADGKPQVEITAGDEFSRSNAAIALAYGTTTIRNPAGSTQANARYDAMIASGEWIGPYALHAGEVIQPPPFAGESFAYPTTHAEWDAEAARQAAAGMTYFKLYTDLTEEELTSGVKAAKAHGLIPIAHLNNVGWTRALELGVEQFEHALPTSPSLLEPSARAQFSFGADYMIRWWELADLDGHLMQELVGQLVANRAEVDLTLMVNELVYFPDEWDSRFPDLAGELPDYIHPAQAAALEPNYAALRTVPPEQLARGKAVWRKVLGFAKLLHEAGVRLMIGTDSTGGSAMSYELENHAEAGIDTWEILRMATSGNADLMGLADTGRVAPSYEADVVFLRANPVSDVRNVEKVAFVLNNGSLFDRGALLDIAREIATNARSRSQN